MGILGKFGKKVKVPKQPSPKETHRQKPVGSVFRYPARELAESQGNKRSLNQKYKPQESEPVEKAAEEIPVEEIKTPDKERVSKAVNKIQLMIYDHELQINSSKDEDSYRVKNISDLVNAFNECSYKNLEEISICYVILGKTEGKKERYSDLIYCNKLSLLELKGIISKYWDIVENFWV